MKTRRRTIINVSIIFLSLFVINVHAEEKVLEASDPAFTKELKERRERVFDLMNDDSMLVLLPSKYKNRNNDVSWAYRQTNDLFYLTGSTHADTYLVLIKSARKNSEYLFHKEGNPQHEQWIGILPTTEQVKIDTGIEDVYTQDKFKTFISAVLNGREFRTGGRTGESNRPKNYSFFETLTEGRATIWLSLGRNRHYESKQTSSESIFSQQISKQYPEIKIRNITSPLNRLREVKSKYELNKLQQAIDITVNAQKKAMQRVKTAQWEYQVQAIIDFTFRDQGACCPAFPSITASGSNTTILHYETPNAKIEQDKLFLSDIGAEVDYYAADVTRTYPADGSFSKVQKEVYSAVLKAQKIGIKKSKIGATITSIEAAIIDSIGDDLLKMGLIDKKEKKQIFVYYAHGFGHSLGMDVHDTFIYHQKLKKNMVITVEPGIYVRKSKVESAPFYEALSDEGKKRIDEALVKYDGIGVRIEDDILIARGGAKILSKNAPREIEAIEQWMAKD